MQTKNYLSIIAISAIIFSACNSKSESVDVKTPEQTPVAEVAKQSAVEGDNKTLATNDVPEPVRTSFTTKYPKANGMTWMLYTPEDIDDMPMDNKYYYVRYNNDGADYTSWYNNRGEWVKTSTKVPGHAGLPDAVNKTINAQYPGYTISEIDKENDKNRDMYEIELNKGESKVKLKILPDGKIFKKKEK